MTAHLGPHFSQSASSRSSQVHCSSPKNLPFEHLPNLQPSQSPPSLNCKSIAIDSQSLVTPRYLFYNVQERPQTIHARRGRHLCHGQSRRCEFHLRPAEPASIPSDTFQKQSQWLPRMHMKLNWTLWSGRKGCGGAVGARGTASSATLGSLIFGPVSANLF